jgi:Lon protease-like protein
MLPPMIPIFPLPSVVLFPAVFLPLHIFEPRYLEMVQDALTGDRMIGMTLLRPGWEHEYEGRPPVYGVGCVGLISHVERQPDGTHDIVLRGLEKFRITDEDHGRSYRRATVSYLPEIMPPADRPAVQQDRRRLELLIAPAAVGSDPPLPAGMPDEDVVNALAQYLDLEPVERQALLECDGVVARARALVELLEMKVILNSGTSGTSGTTWPSN